MRAERNIAKAAPEEIDLERRFRAFIADWRFPCVGAKAAMAHGAVTTLVAGDIAADADDPRVYSALLGFIGRYRRNPGPFQSLAVIYRNPAHMSEAAFEAALWTRVQRLSEQDVRLGVPYDPRVSDDADSPHFSISLGGEAFFIVGLHPHASRPARRFETPVLVFNPHNQFEELRASGLYETLRERITRRDVAFSGSANPMMACFGEVSEARQYSGRQVDETWKCPFTHGGAKASHDP